MAESTKEDDIEKLLKPQIHPKIIKKEIKIHEYKGQYSVKLPKLILEELGLTKNDLLEIEFNTKTREHTIKLKKKNDKTKKTITPDR